MAVYFVRKSKFLVFLKSYVNENSFLKLQYILTGGLDSIVKLWELSTNRCLIAYTGAGATGVQEYPIQASFNHNEDYGL